MTTYMRTAVLTRSLRTRWLDTLVQRRTRDAAAGALLALAAAVAIPIAYAGPFDDITQSVSKAASDALSNAVNSALNGSSSRSASPKLGGSPSVGAGNVSQGVAPQAPSGKFQCLSQEFTGDSNHIQNTCPKPIFVQAYFPQLGYCRQTPLGPGKTAKLSPAGKIVAVCRTITKIRECQCPSGAEITATQ